jgi:hypothetical protein
MPHHGLRLGFLQSGRVMSGQWPCIACTRKMTRNDVLVLWKFGAFCSLSVKQQCGSQR